MKLCHDPLTGDVFVETKLGRSSLPELVDLLRRKKGWTWGELCKASDDTGRVAYSAYKHGANFSVAFISALESLGYGIEIGERDAS